MPTQLGQKVLQQRRPVRLAGQVIADAPRFGEPVAQLPEIARASASGDDAAERAADVGQMAQHVPHVRAQQRIAVEPLDQRQPLGDRRLVGQRGGEILGQLPRPGAGDAAIDRRQQTAGAAAALRLDHFQAGARGRVHRQPRSAVLRHRRQQQRQLPAAGVVEISDQPAGRRQHGTGELAEAVERGNAVHRLQPRLALIAGEVLARARDRFERHPIPSFLRNQLAGPNSRQCRG